MALGSGHVENAWQRDATPANLAAKPLCVLGNCVQAPYARHHKHGTYFSSPTCAGACAFQSGRWPAIPGRQTRPDTSSARSWACVCLISCMGGVCMVHGAHDMTVVPGRIGVLPCSLFDPCVGQRLAYTYAYCCAAAWSARQAATQPVRSFVLHIPMYVNACWLINHALLPARPDRTRPQRRIMSQSCDVSTHNKSQQQATSAPLI